MSKKKSNLKLTPKERGAKLLQISELQKQLRTALTTFLKSSGKTVSSLCTSSKIPTVTVDRFVNYDHALSSENVLRVLGSIVGNPELAERIIMVGEGISDQWLGMAMAPIPALKLAINIHATFEQLPQAMSAESFSKGFSPNDMLVLGCLHRSKQVCMRLADDPKVVNHINSVLASRFWEHDNFTLKNPTVSEFNVVVGQLKPRYPSYNSLLEALYCDTRTFHKVIQGRSTEKATAKYLARAKKLLEKAQLENFDCDIIADGEPGTVNFPEPVAEFPQVTILESATEDKPLVDQVYALIGAKSPLGVNGVITKESFRVLEVEYSDELIEVAARCLRSAVGILNTVTQLGSEDRLKAKKKLDGLTGELEIALRMYAAAVPGVLTELYDSQRETWAHDIKNERPPYQGKRKER